MEWERARSEEQKEFRVQEIIDAALELFQEIGFDKITYALIADKNGSARSNIYKYFATKEEIFLEVLRRDIGEWSLSVQGDLKKGLLNSDTPVERFAQYWLDRFFERQRMTDTLSMLHTILEKNVSPEALVKFESTMKESFEGLVPLLVEYGIFPENEKARDFLMVQQALIQGGFPRFHLSADQKAAMEKAGASTREDRYKNLLIQSMSATIASLRG